MQENGEGEHWMNDTETLVVLWGFAMCIRFAGLVPSVHFSIGLSVLFFWYSFLLIL